MKALLSKEPGGPETLEWTELPDPVVQKGELLIEVRAAGVNFPDTLMIRDLYQIKPPRPFAPGGEISGVVTAIGEGVKDFEIGDRILALTGHGGFATKIRLPATQAIKIPDEMPFEDAACFIFTYGTSYHALVDRAHLMAGEKLLVLGASGGVGAAALEIGKALGAHVVAAVSSAEKAAFCTALGANETLVYKRSLDQDEQRSFGKELKRVSKGEGFDVIYDAVGGPYTEPSLRSMAWDGRYLVVGFPAGIPQIPLNLPLLKGCDIRGVFWGASVFQDPNQHAANVSALFKLYLSGQICPAISAKYDMVDGGQALEAMQDRGVLGKVVLINSD